jgi:hypothetical protein
MSFGDIVKVWQKAAPYVKSFIKSPLGTEIIKAIGFGSTPSSQFGYGGGYAKSHNHNVGQAHDQGDKEEAEKRVWGEASSFSLKTPTGHSPMSERARKLMKRSTTVRQLPQEESKTEVNLTELTAELKLTRTDHLTVHPIIGKAQTFVELTGALEKGTMEMSDDAIERLWAGLDEVNGKRRAKSPLTDTLKKKPKDKVHEDHKDQEEDDYLSCSFTDQFSQSEFSDSSEWNLDKIYLEKCEKYGHDPD